MTEPIKSLRDSAGKALYLEFRKPGYTYQMVIAPSVVGLDGRATRLTTMSRRMNTVQARKNWGFASSFQAPNAIDPDTNLFISKDDEQAKEIGASALNFVTSTLSNLFHKEYKLFKNPIAVEISYEEIQSLQANKTPASLIRRIQRNRVAQGFGEEIAYAE